MSKGFYIAVGIFALGLWMLLSGAKAGEMQLAHGVWCDTKEQVVTLFDAVVVKDGELENGLKLVNTGTTPSCAVGIVAIIPGNQVARLEHKGQAYGVFEVLVIAFKSANGMIRLPQPMIQYGSRPLEEQKA